jgi:o-succinylbenzoate synthase
VLRTAELFRVHMPLVQPFGTATSNTAAKDALLVRVETEHGVGWGECSAQLAPTYLAETIDSSRLALRDHLIPRAFKGLAFDDVVGNTAARAALQCALFDAELRAEGRSLAERLAATRTHVTAGAALGIAPDDITVPLAAARVAEGYRRLKLKIAPGRAADIVRVVRAEVGDDVEIAVDANGEYSNADDDALRALDQFDLQCLEQPFPADDLGAHAELARTLRTPICLDESIGSRAVAIDAIAMGACALVSVKAARVGGLIEARAIERAGAERGTPVLAGGMLETGIGRAALVALAARPGFTATGDVAGSAHYFGPDNDLTEDFVVREGKIAVPTGPGLGVEVRPEQLARYTVARERLSARDE